MPGCYITDHSPRPKATKVLTKRTTTKHKKEDEKTLMACPGLGVLYLTRGCFDFTLSACLQKGRHLAAVDGVVAAVALLLLLWMLLLLLLPLLLLIIGFLVSGRWSVVVHHLCAACCLLIAIVYGLSLFVCHVKRVARPV